MKDGGAQPGEVTQPYGNSYPRPARLLPILLASKYEKTWHGASAEAIPIISIGLGVSLIIYNQTRGQHVFPIATKSYQIHPLSLKDVRYPLRDHCECIFFVVCNRQVLRAELTNERGMKIGE